MTDGQIEISIKQKAYQATPGGDRRVAIENLELSVGTREFLCIVGPSGCGKTTLLNIIAGLDRNVLGTVKLGNGQSQHNTRISNMFQTPRHLPRLTVLDNGQVVLAETHPDKYGSQSTGGRGSIRRSYMRLRKAGATAREMLIEAASIKWDVPAEECKAQMSKVIHSKSKCV